MTEEEREEIYRAERRMHALERVSRDRSYIGVVLTLAAIES